MQEAQAGREEVLSSGERARLAETRLGNIGYVRRLWDAFETGGVAAMKSLVSPDVRWQPLDAGGRVLNGTGALDAFWSAREVEVPSPRMYHSRGDDVLVEAEYHRAGACARTVWSLYRFEADRLVEAVSFEDEAQARGYSPQ